MPESWVKDKIIVNSNTMKLTITRKANATEDGWLKAQKELLGDILVFVKCPRCERDVPHIDMMKSGVCYLCQDELEKMKDFKEIEKVAERTWIIKTPEDAEKFLQDTKDEETTKK